jgi:uncharacterized membrane protein
VLVVLVHRSAPDKVLPEISRFGGEMIQSTLSVERGAQPLPTIETCQRAEV